jgi:hypothetical protein
MKSIFKTIVFYAALLLSPAISPAQDIKEMVKRIESIYGAFNGNTGFDNTCKCVLNKDSLKKVAAQLVENLNTAGFFPGYSETGKEVSDHYYEILVDAGITGETAQKAIQLMYNQVLKKNANVEKYANYIDRQNYKRTQKQVYGTMISIDNIGSGTEDIRFNVFPIEDNENVESRRASIGLPTIKETLEKFRQSIAGTGNSTGLPCCVVKQN